METNNMNIRERFEEIWPVPRGITWSECGYGYEPTPPNLGDDYYYEISCEWDARLDTFTRCQETTDVYVSLVDELVREFEAERNGRTWTGDNYPNLETWERQSNLLDRAKQIMGDKK